MSIKPIDLQTNMGQVHEVARNQHAHIGAMSEQLHHLDKEADDKSKNADYRTEETREAEHTGIRLDDHKEEEQGRRKQGRQKKRSSLKPPAGKVVEFVENGNLGNIIDIRK
jgi:hypothetical protein